MAASADMSADEAFARQLQEEEERHAADERRRVEDDQRLAEQLAQQPNRDVAGEATTDESVAAKKLDPTDSWAMPYFRDYELLIEFKQLPQNVPSGVYVMPAFDDLQVWHGVIFLRQGIYKEGIFKFVMNVPDDYPHSPPSVYFLSNVYHPLVDYDGHFDIQRAFPKWQARQDRLWHVLKFMKKSFYQVSLHNPLNQEAAQLYLDHPEVFEKKVQACVAESIDNQYDSPIEGCPIQFSVWNGHVHPHARAQVLQLQNDRGDGSPGTLGDQLWTMARQGFKKFWS